jgi:predicted amidohydrolase YtcJ
LYRFKTLLDYNTILSFGSDWPVVDANPIDTMYVAVTRITPSHGNGFYNEERIKIEEAINAYTNGSSYAGFLEDRIGKIEVNYLADFVIIDQDITNIPVEKIPTTKIIKTLIDGKIVYENELFN